MFDGFRNEELEMDAKWKVELPLDDELTKDYEEE